MRWDDFRRSDNVEDDRDGGGGGGGGFGIPVGGGGLGIGTVVVLGLIGWALGIDPSMLIGGAEIISGGGSQYQQPSQPANRRTGAPNDQTGEFVAAVLGNTEDTWSEIFQASGQQYRAPRLRLFAGGDTGRLRLRASGDGAVLLPDRQAHLSRHVVLPRDRGALPRLQRQGLQIRRGLCDRARGRPSRAEPARHPAEGAGAQRAAGSKAAANRIQVRVELQADCFAGVWANHSEQRKSFLEPGDVEAALQTAAAIGDDTLQKQSRGAVVPDAFTHGSSEQRQRWFTNGLKEGKVSACDTFAAAQL